MHSSRPVPLRSLHVTGCFSRKIKATDVKHAIQHAQNLCFNFEDTYECRSAWETVDELTRALDRQSLRRSLETPEDEKSRVRSEKLSKDVLRKPSPGQVTLHCHDEGDGWVNMSTR